MNNEISKTETNVTNELDTNEAVVRGQNLADEQIKKSTGLISLFWKDKTAVQVQKKMQEAAMVELEERVRAFKLHSEANIQRLEEEFNTALLNVKAEERRKLVAKITSAYNQMMEDLNQKDADFNINMEKSLEEIEKINIEKLKEQKMMAFDKAIQGYFNMRNVMIERFEDLVKEIIKV